MLHLLHCDCRQATAVANRTTQQRASQYRKACPQKSQNPVPPAGNASLIVFFCFSSFETRQTRQKLAMWKLTTAIDSIGAGTATRESTRLAQVQRTCSIFVSLVVAIENESANTARTQPVPLMAVVCTFLTVPERTGESKPNREIYCL